MGYTRACEPLRVWNRLEARPRRPDFSRALRASVHDPLWMLARQWQFGEFKGEDTGSPVYAKLAMRSAPITGFRNRQGATQTYSSALPLEARVEREPIPAGVGACLQAGRLWLRILDHHGKAARGAAYDAAGYRVRYAPRFPFHVPANTGTTPADVAARAAQAANFALQQHLAAVAGRAIDGIALAAVLPAGDFGWASLPASIKDGVPPADQAFVLAATKAFRDSLGRIATQPESATDTAWSDDQVEYQFNCTVPRPHGGTLALKADEYTTGRLDWYTFELGIETVPNPPPPGDPSITTDVFTMIPTPAEFPGQPNPRFWQLEDGAVDLGNIRADSTDLAKMLVAEFALVYGNNWYVVPCPQRVGSLAEILGIVIDDVFGQRSLVRSATRNAPADWTRWDLFSLGRRPAAANAGTLGSHLFLPPAVHGVMESDAVESVRLIRDEMANTVWAVEARVDDGFGRGRDGHDAARRFVEAIRREEPTAPETAPDPVADAAKLRYILGNQVPENWIPFIPVKQTGNDRQIRLQRASMPRFFQNTVRAVRPRTRLLRAGIDASDVQTAPLFVNEEEVPRAGVQIDAMYQRARWYDGRSVLWYGRRVRSGRGEGSSGLRFDVLEDVK